MSRSANKVLASRDFKHYRLVDSPVAGIFRRYYEFLASEAAQATTARYAYAHCFLGVEPCQFEDYIGSQLDMELRKAFSHPPKLVLAQGPMLPYGLFKRAEDDRSSLSSGTSNPPTGIVVDPYDSIFVSWTIHQHLKDAIEGDDEEERRFSAYFAFASVVHESAHWLAVSKHGYIHDPKRDEVYNLRPVDGTIAQIQIHSRDDAGTEVKELLLGHAYQYISYADGSNEVVSQRILPLIPHLKPILGSAIQAHILGCELPHVIDITRWGKPNVRETPKWKDQNGMYLVVSCISPDVACHHGACRKWSARR